MPKRTARRRSAQCRGRKTSPSGKLQWLPFLAAVAVAIAQAPGPLAVHCVVVQLRIAMREYSSVEKTDEGACELGAAGFAVGALALWASVCDATLAGGGGTAPPM
jgi:hypothetical protein